MKNDAGSNPLAFMASPFNFSGNDDDHEISKATLKEQDIPSVVNHSTGEAESPVAAVKPAGDEDEVSDKNEDADDNNSQFAFVNFVQDALSNVPELKEHQEKQVQEALTESQRVIKETNGKK